jgi:hypothetical protein
MRQLRRPIVRLVVGVLVVQALVAGVATAQAAVRIATFGADAIILCHGNGADDPGDSGQGRAAHDCCAFCGAAGPAALPAVSTQVLMQLLPVWRIELPVVSDIRTVPRAIRAGPSQAPPIVA